MESPLLHVVLYQPEIAPNVGAVGRTCVGVGAKLWLVRPLGFTITDKQLRRAGLDYWQYLDLEIVDHWEALCERLPAVETAGYYLSKKASRGYTDATFTRGSILVFGCESNGLPPTFLTKAASRALRIPIRPEVRSLNLSVSVGITVFEAKRQIDLSDGAAEA